MIKGAQKQMIVLRTGTSKYFEEAYFVLKGGINPSRGDRTDILSEANRILKESESVRNGKKKAHGPWTWFGIGLAVGSVLMLALGLLF